MPPPVRKAGVRDLPHILRLNGPVQAWHAAQMPETYRRDPPPEMLDAFYRERLEGEGCIILLSGEPPQGYAVIRVEDRPATAHALARRRLMLDEIAVDPAARRQGHGRALMAALQAVAVEHGCTSIALTTLEANAGAQAFFAASGFAPLLRLMSRPVP